MIAQNVDEIVDHMVTASIVASKMSEVGTDRQALTRRLGTPDDDPEEIL